MEINVYFAELKNLLARNLFLSFALNFVDDIAFLLSFEYFKLRKKDRVFEYSLYICIYSVISLKRILD